MQNPNLEPYLALIQTALISRWNQPNYLDPHPVHGERVYIVQLCEALVELVRAHGNTSATIQDLLKAERTAWGRSNYQVHFAQQCHLVAQQSMD
ncbi:conserved hypothetical protein [Pseudomonas veronii]|nr:conserved hypothetical protein [Pseudomonas veronii]